MNRDEKKAKLQRFLLPFMGGFTGMFFAYLYMNYFNIAKGVTNILVIGSLAGVLIGAFSTKLIQIKLSNRVKNSKNTKPKLPWRLKVINRIDFLRKLFGISSVVIMIILWSKVILIPYILIPIPFTMNYPAYMVIGCIYWIIFFALPFFLAMAECFPGKYILYTDGFPQQGSSDLNLKLKVEFLVSFKRHKTKFFFNTLWEISSKTLFYSFLTLLLVLFLFFLLISSLVIILVLFGVVLLLLILRGILALLGGSIFWSSWIISVISVAALLKIFLPSMNGYMPAVIISAMTGFFAGYVYSMLLFPFFNPLELKIRSMPKTFRSEHPEGFIKFLFNFSVLVFCKKSWAYAKKNIFKNYSLFKGD